VISQLDAFGPLIRWYRNLFEIMANTSAAKVSISRVTLHRIRVGRAYRGAIGALDLNVHLSAKGNV
jgi:hypothetical protein